MNQLLTPEQVAEILQVNVQTIRRYVREGKIPGAKIGDVWRIRTEDLEAFIAQNQEKAAIHA